MGKKPAATILLSQGLDALIDEEDLPLVSRYKWYAAKSSHGLIYAVTRVRMHRLITDAPYGLYVDHINGNPLDNRKENLRLCTNAQNQQNTDSRGGSSRFKGVSFHRKTGKWWGHFSVLGETYNCGLWDTEEEAARAVDRRRKEVCGEFARLNFPEDEGEE